MSRSVSVTTMMRGRHRALLEQALLGPVILDADRARRSAPNYARACGRAASRRTATACRRSSAGPSATASRRHDRVQPSMPQTMNSLSVSTANTNSDCCTTGLVAQALVQAHRDVRDGDRGERVLAQHFALEHVEREAREERREDAAGVRRVDAPSRR